MKFLSLTCPCKGVVLRPPPYEPPRTASGAGRGLRAEGSAHSFGMTAECCACYVSAFGGFLTHSL